MTPLPTTTKKLVLNSLKLALYNKPMQPPKLFPSSIISAILKMQSQSAASKLLFAFLTFSCLLYHGLGAKCAANAPTVQQTQVGFGEPPKFMVEVHNNCPMCPIINIHLNCGNFPQTLVNPRLLKVLGYDDCVVNSGLPLAPLQKFSFNYTHQKLLMHPTTWYFQCE